MPEKKDICSLTYEELVREMGGGGRKEIPGRGRSASGST